MGFVFRCLWFKFNCHQKLLSAIQAIDEMTKPIKILLPDFYVSI